MRQARRPAPPDSVVVPPSLPSAQASPQSNRPAGSRLGPEERSSGLASGQRWQPRPRPGCCKPCSDRPVPACRFRTWGRSSELALWRLSLAESTLSEATWRGGRRKGPIGIGAFGRRGGQGSAVRRDRRGHPAKRPCGVGSLTRHSRGRGWLRHESRVAQDDSRAGRGQWPVGRQARRDFVDYPWLRDERDAAHRGAAAWACRGVELVDAANELCPSPSQPSRLGVGGDVAGVDLLRTGTPGCQTGTRVALATGAHGVRSASGISPTWTRAPRGEYGTFARGSGMRSGPQQPRRQPYPGTGGSLWGTGRRFRCPRPNFVMVRTQHGENVIAHTRASHYCGPGPAGCAEAVSTWIVMAGSASVAGWATEATTNPSGRFSAVCQ